MNLIRIGRIVVNFDRVTEIIQGDPAGPHPEAFVVNLGHRRSHTFRTTASTERDPWHHRPDTSPT